MYYVQRAGRPVSSFYLLQMQTAEPLRYHEIPVLDCFGNAFKARTCFESSAAVKALFVLQ
jgi:hypothetical protein